MVYFDCGVKQMSFEGTSFALGRKLCDSQALGSAALGAQLQEGLFIILGLCVRTFFSSFLLTRLVKNKILTSVDVYVEIQTCKDI